MKARKAPKFSSSAVCSPTLPDIVERQCTEISHGSDQKNVVSGSVRFRDEDERRSGGKNAVAPHAEEKPRGTQPLRQDRCPGLQESESTPSPETKPDRLPAAHIHECGFKIGEGMPVGPDALPQVNFNGADNAREHTDQNRGEQNIAAWILYFL